MKVITPELKAHIAQGTTSLATCWRLELTDGTILGFTDHDVDIEYDGVTYEAETGFTPTQYESSSDISRKDNLFVAEVRSLSQAVQQQTGRIYTAQCDAVLGDGRCKVNLASFTETGTVTSVTNSFTFTDSSNTEDTDYFQYGLLTWTVGDNAGRSMEVKEFTTGGNFVLFQPMASAIQVGDQYSVYAGCNKQFDTCGNKFNNRVNYRGFPQIPSKDNMGKIR